jgi:hypothetical protein
VIYELSWVSNENYNIQKSSQFDILIWVSNENYIIQKSGQFDILGTQSNFTLWVRINCILYFQLCILNFSSMFQWRTTLNYYCFLVRDIMDLSWPSALRSAPPIYFFLDSPLGIPHCYKTWFFSDISYFLEMPFFSGWFYRELSLKLVLEMGPSLKIYLLTRKIKRLDNQF